jgi:hypothetical protein
MGFRILEQDCAPKSEQRAQDAASRLRHGGRSAHSATAQQVMQNGFRLIIRMVRKENPVGRLVR